MAANGVALRSWFYQLKINRVKPIYAKLMLLARRVYSSFFLFYEGMVKPPQAAKNKLLKDLQLW